VTAAALDGATKCFGTTVAVDAATFEIGEGEIVALLGPNGAGKTTSIALLLGLRRPDAGRATIFGRDPRRAATRRLVGATPQEMTFPHALRVAEIVDLVRAHYESPPARDDVISRFGLADVARRQVGGLSGGQRRRVAVALAFAGGAPLVVLDEPTAGLDVEARRAVWEAVRAHGASGGSVLLTTHYLHEAEALASRVVVIEGGRVVADSEISAVKAAGGLTHVHFRTSRSDIAVDGARREGDHLDLLVRDAGAVVKDLVRRGVALDDLEVRPASLEEALDALRGRR
jgi:ABC-2 type transport system ATP-binding protein